MWKCYSFTFFIDSFFFLDTWANGCVGRRSYTQQDSYSCVCVSFYHKRILKYTIAYKICWIWKSNFWTDQKDGKVRKQAVRGFKYLISIEMTPYQKIFQFTIKWWPLDSFWDALLRYQMSNMKWSCIVAISVVH